MALITDPDDLGQLNELREPPGGKCAFAECGQDAVMAMEVKLPDMEGLHAVKLCGKHQMLMVRQFTPPDGDAVITETCEIVYKGQRLRVEDGRLIREGPDG